DDHDIFSGVHHFRRRGLMGVGPLNSFARVGSDQVRVRPCWEFRELRVASREVTDGGDDFAERIALGEGFEDFVYSRYRRGAPLLGVGSRKGPSDSSNGWANGERFGHGESLRKFAFCSLRLTRGPDVRNTLVQGCR